MVMVYGPSTSGCMFAWLMLQLKLKKVMSHELPELIWSPGDITS